MAKSFKFKRIISIGNFLSPIIIESSLRALVAKSDFLTHMETNISNSNKPISKSNKSTSDAETNECVAPRLIRTLID